MPEEAAITLMRSLSLIFPTPVTVAGRSWHLPARVERELRWLPGRHRAGPSAPLDEVHMKLYAQLTHRRGDLPARGPTAWT
ncbi:hypothetical protein Athai_02880 [Actinocatenispora thailandica]|uniref:Uncharacterized protein n=1 Tax=Actinocatenispora thailandica TaxID=227318 RepID=A0A7R7DJC4_9ACTN|nr:hypothetical protein Athai_02880 [Actinocatenispora thailandica]